MDMKNPFFYFVLILAMAVSPAWAQLHRNLDIPVTVNNKFLPNAWAGGLNYCQFSEIDLDGDGKMDLFVFDRSGHKVSTYLNTGSNGQAKYTFAPQYASRFPKMSNWALLRDYNCDGLMDIFTHTSGGIAVYRNHGTGENLKFTLASTLLKSDYGPGTYNLYVSSEDIPAIIDLDGDGDLEILTFNPFGSTIELHVNESKEKFGTCDSLIYKNTTQCWGGFIEDNSGNISLNQSCRPGETGQYDDNTRDKNRHAGSTSLVLDLNKDGAFDLVLGDIGSTNMVSLINGQTSTDAKMVSVDYAFPNAAKPVDIRLFPAGYYLDIDNDGIKDLIVAPNAQNVSENHMGVWYYKNKRATNHPDFEFIKSNFLQDEMIEVGESAFPVLFDYNGDGLLDLVVGNYGYTTFNGGHNSRLALFKNVGTKSAPAFQLITTDYANISSLNIRNAYPTFGDLDGDGDMDMLIGEQGGNFIYFENVAGAGNVANFVLQTTNYFNITAGQWVTPQLFDVNKDGKLDIISGGMNGVLTYYPNTGTSASPVFSNTNRIRPFGNVDVRVQGFTTGYSVPHFYYDKTDSQMKLLVGSENGRIYFYEDIEQNINGSFTLKNPHVGLLNEGAKTAPVISYELSDISPVLIVGNLAGGLSYFDNAINLSVEKNIPERTKIKVYPVPASQMLHISLGNVFSGECTVSLYNLLGNKVYERKVLDEAIHTLNTSEFADGIYILQVNSQGRTANEKIVIKKR
jgi:hypothetical protein